MSTFRRSKLVSLPILVLCAVSIGCSSMKAVELSPEQLRSQIRAGELVRPGDRLLVITTDGEQYRFKVTSMDERALRGDAISVPIDEVVAVRARQFSAGKTALLTAGTVGVVYVVIIAVSSAAILAAAAP